MMSPTRRCSACVVHSASHASSRGHASWWERNASVVVSTLRTAGGTTILHVVKTEVVERVRRPKLNVHIELLVGSFNKVYLCVVIQCAYRFRHVELKNVVHDSWLVQNRFQPIVHFVNSRRRFFDVKYFY